MSIRDAAVAVGLPCSEPEFASAARLGSDFLSGLPPGASFEKQFAEPARHALEGLRALGVEVVQEAGLGQVAEILGRKRVVGIAGHHPLALVKAADVASPQRILAVLEAATDGPSGVVRERIAQRCGPDADAAGIADAINELLTEGSAHYNVWARERDLSDEMSQTTSFPFSRIWMDRRFGGALRQGPCMELWGGMITVGEFVGTMSGFSGGVDLMVCNSVLHADAVKETNSRVLFLANAGLTQPASRLERFHAMMGVLAEYGPIDVRLLFQAALAGARQM